jgi:large conductance mechanosensitive channel
MGMIKEFKEFALKGSVLDLAIGIIIGAAFTGVVNSFIENILTPLLLKPALDAANLKNLENLSWGAVKYGLFLSALLSFLIVAWVLFLVIKGINRFRRREESAPAGPSSTDALLMEIRDELRKK